MRQTGFVTLLAMREKASQTLPFGSIGARRQPKREHSIEGEPVDRLGDAGLFDLARDSAKTERVERDRCRGFEERQVAKARRELVVAHRQVLVDALVLD